MPHNSPLLHQIEHLRRADLLSSACKKMYLPNFFDILNMCFKCVQKRKLFCGVLSAFTPIWTLRLLICYHGLAKNVLAKFHLCTRYVKKNIWKPLQFRAFISASCTILCIKNIRSVIRTMKLIRLSFLLVCIQRCNLNLFFWGGTWRKWWIFSTSIMIMSILQK